MEDDQQYCLRWNNHQSTLISVFDTLLENGTLVDCTLAAEGKFLHAHKVVLSACSPYFETLLSQNYDKHPIFILKDVKYQELKAMMDYMYRGEVNISQDQLGALLKAAESLQIKGLSDNRNGSASSAGGGGDSEPAPKKAATGSGHHSAAAASSHPSDSLPKGQGLTLEQRQHKTELGDDRDGSISPGPRRRKRVRRRSEEHIEQTQTPHHQHHDSNSSESHQSAASAVGLLNTVNATTAVSKAAAAAAAASGSAAAVGSGAIEVPQPIRDSKSEILARQSHDNSSNSSSITTTAAATNNNSTIVSTQQVPMKEKLEAPDHTEIMLEPKAEYDDANEDSIEDLTLDDDELSNMDQMDDGAGPSHGNMGEGSSQGFAWHMNQGQDDVFLAAQEAVGAHRDSQELLRRILETGNASGGGRISTSQQQYRYPPAAVPLPLDAASLLRFRSLAPQLLVAAKAGAGSARPAAVVGLGHNSVGSDEKSTVSVQVTARALVSTPSAVNSASVDADANGLTGCDSQRFHCSKCSKSYKNKRHLYRHEKEECIDIQPRFKCVLCDQLFRRKYHLARHMNNRHGLGGAAGAAGGGGGNDVNAETNGDEKDSVAERMNAMDMLELVSGGIE